MFTTTTAIRATSGETSHGIGASMIPRDPRAWFRMPLSWSRMDRQTALETISGISQGSSSSARSTPLSGKFWWKNSAINRPTTNWPRIEPRVNSAVLTIALAKI